MGGREPGAPVARPASTVSEARPAFIPRNPGSSRGRDEIEIVSIDRSLPWIRVSASIRVRRIDTALEP